MKKLALTILTTAVLTTALTGCGDEVDTLEKRVTQGQWAGEAVDGAQDLNKEQAEQIEGLLGN